PKRVTVRVTADSLFVLPDSAARDPRGDWAVARSDTIRAWRVEGEGVIEGWIDRQGRMVEGMLLGLVPLRRTTYELAYDAWNEDAARGRLTSNRDIQETAAIAASAPITDKHRMPRLGVVLRGTPLDGYNLDGARQTLPGDTLVVERATDTALRAEHSLGDADSS